MALMERHGSCGQSGEGRSSKWGNESMTMKLLISSACHAVLAMPLAAQAQGIPGGAAHGFYEGNRIAGPIGAVVGIAVGGAIGGVEGVLGVDQRYYVQAPDTRHYRPHRRYHAHVRSRRRG
jgi:hypothetical protein